MGDAKAHSLSRLGERETQRWRELAAQAIEPNPFFEPIYAIPAAAALQEPAVSLLVVEDESGWRACLPVQKARLGGAVRVLRTWRHAYCFLGTPLLREDDPAGAAQALLELAVKMAPGSRVALEQFADDGPAGSALREAAEALGLAPLVESSHERALLVRHEADDDSFGLSRKRRKDLARRRRRLEEELDADLEMRRVAADDASIERFLDLERSGWKGDEGTALASDPAHADFFRRFCRDFAAEGRLELLALTAGDRTVAMLCDLRSGDGRFAVKVAYDAELNRFGPGVQLEYESIRDFYESGDASWVDSCADPGNEMINQLWPGRRRIATSVIARGGVRSAGWRRVLRAAHAARSS